MSGSDYEYKKARQHFLEKFFKRGFIFCEKCGKSATVSLWNKEIRIEGNIDIHHIEGRGRRPDLKAVASNFVPLCRRCHSHIHTGGKDEQSEEKKSE